MPGSAAGAEVRKEGDTWTLVLVRDLRHPPAKVWRALTDPAHLQEWAPFDADRNLATAGPVKLTTVGAPTPQVSETTVKRAEAPRLLEYNWGGGELRWELEPLGSGTRLTLWHNIDRRQADGNAPVQAYIAAMPGWKRDVGRRLDALIVRTVPGARKAVKMELAVLRRRGPGLVPQLPLLHEVREGGFLPRHLAASCSSWRVQAQRSALRLRSAPGAAHDPPAQPESAPIGR